jgi:hypothetical protein
MAHANQKRQMRDRELAIRGLTDFLLLLEEVEKYQRLMEGDRQEMFEHLDRNPELNGVWESFIGRGGVKAADLRLFLSGDFNKPRVITRANKCMRLVVSNKPKRKIERKRLDPEKMKVNRRRRK